MESLASVRCAAAAIGIAALPYCRRDIFVVFVLLFCFVLFFFFASRGALTLPTMLDYLREAKSTAVDTLAALTLPAAVRVGQTWEEVVAAGRSAEPNELSTVNSALVVVVLDCRVSCCGPFTGPLRKPLRKKIIKYVEFFISAGLFPLHEVIQNFFFLVAQVPLSMCTSRLVAAASVEPSICLACRHRSSMRCHISKIYFSCNAIGRPQLSCLSRLALPI